MKSRKGAMSALCLVGLLVAACGDNNKSSTGGTTAPAAGGTTAPATGGTTAAGGTSAPAAGGDSLLNGTIKCTQQYAGKEVHISGVVLDTENDQGQLRVDEYRCLGLDETDENG